MDFTQRWREIGESFGNVWDSAWIRILPQGGPSAGTRGLGALAAGCGPAGRQAMNDAKGAGGHLEAKYRDN
jgi:hypothetical protein